MSSTRTLGALLLVTAVVVAAVPLGSGRSARADILPPLPNPPQLNQLPGATLVPDLSRVPGGPQVQGVVVSGSAPVTDPALGGVFSAPFAPPGANCPNETAGSPPGTPTEGPPAGRTANDIACKPAAVNVVVLPNGKILYWDGLEAEEAVQYSEVLEYGDKAANDQSRILTLNLADPAASTYATPAPADGGADNRAYTQYLVGNAPGPLGAVVNDPGNATGALFCSDQVILATGDVLTPGGTQYYAEPRVPQTPFGVAELEGIRNTRLFHPADGTWTASGPMHFGRWYPSLVTLADGRVFVASGVTKLVKPVYSSHPLMSGTNVEQTETYDPATGTWTWNGDAASRALPLYPRLHLLPDGHVYYDAGGQVFNPFGQSYDEALWNVAASYDPARRTWTTLGVPFGVSVDPSRPLDAAIAAGFRGSTFSLMLPLVPDRRGHYTEAQFLSAGGVLGTTPGAYLATTSSVVDTVTTGDDGREHFSSAPTAPLVNARWFSSAVLLPTGQVVAFSGANRDEVVGPGTGFAVTQAELFDPATRRWTPAASGHEPRTYHNTAVLLPSGQVLVGGSAPINTLYAYDQTLPGGFSSGFRNPSFEIYDPPYLHWGLPQPTITGLSTRDLRYGTTLTLVTPQASSIAEVVLVRNPALTHLVDGDQRSVVLPIVARHGSTITVAGPPSGAVAPPGPYMLFVDQRTPRGLIPSTAAQVWVGAPLPAYLDAPSGTSHPPAPGAHSPAAREASAPPTRSAAGEGVDGSGRTRAAAVRVPPSPTGPISPWAPWAPAAVALAAAAVAARYQMRRG